MRKTIRAFDSNVRDLDETDDASSIIDSHILSWKFVLKDLDQPTIAKLKESMTKTEADKLKHDIKGSISRLKMLLRNLDLGELDRGGTISVLKSRVTDMVNL
jgi:hypothetical protein